MRRERLRRDFEAEVTVALPLLALLLLARRLLVAEVGKIMILDRIIGDLRSFSGDHDLRSLF